MNLIFGININGTKNTGLIDVSESPPKVFCYCTEQNADLILKGIAALQKPKRESKLFQIPTIEEIQEYCNQRKNGIDAEKFWHSYNSKDWFVGRVKMKSWKSSIITWEKNPQFNHQEVEKAVIGRQTSTTVKSNLSNWKFQ